MQFCSKFNVVLVYGHMKNMHKDEPGEKAPILNLDREVFQSLLHEKVRECFPNFCREFITDDVMDGFRTPLKKKPRKAKFGTVPLENVREQGPDNGTPIPQNSATFSPGPSTMPHSAVAHPAVSHSAVSHSAVSQSTVPHSQELHGVSAGVTPFFPTYDYAAIQHAPFNVQYTTLNSYGMASPPGIHPHYSENPSQPYLAPVQQVSSGEYPQTSDAGTIPVYFSSPTSHAAISPVVSAAYSERRHTENAWNGQIQMSSTPTWSQPKGYSVGNTSFQEIPESPVGAAEELVSALGVAGIVRVSGTGKSTVTGNEGGGNEELNYSREDYSDDSSQHGNPQANLEEVSRGFDVQRSVYILAVSAVKNHVLA